MTRPHHLSDSLQLSNRRVARLRAAFWAVEDALLAWTVRRAHATIHAAEAPRWDVRDDTVRLLRWVFSRGTELLTCELALSDDDTSYELRTVTALRPASPSTERFADATAAFERQCALEGSLLNDGWTLESYESLVIDRRRTRRIAV